jgi:hypothetical protein
MIWMVALLEAHQSCALHQRKRGQEYHQSMTQAGACLKKSIQALGQSEEKIFQYENDARQTTACRECVAIKVY